ncbi:hypothetical protein MLD38_015630 [Melastoma candidum]|uniref:Uncharacterized protein n=1 Tax=Melastoma candidum TaxID=119954 RepID=A0ACB9RJT7_9MYRT|nr:hypothetical protein MLD38_015630 [Melastoma candidum]
MGPSRLCHDGEKAALPKELPVQQEEDPDREGEEVSEPGKEGHLVLGAVGKVSGEEVEAEASLVGGFISDTYLRRLTTCLIAGAMEILAQAMLTIEARSKQLQPDTCGKSSCLSGGKSLCFYVTLSLYALGTGGVRGSLPALVADQFDQRDHSKPKI